MKSTVYQTELKSHLESYPFWGQKVLAQIGRFDRAHNFHHFSFSVCCFFQSRKFSVFINFDLWFFKIKTVFLSLSCFPTSLNGCRILPLSAAKRNIDLQESMARWPLLQIERPSIWPPRHELKIELARVFCSFSVAGDHFLGRHIAGLVTRQQTAAFKIVLPCRWPDS